MNRPPNIKDVKNITKNPLMIGPDLWWIVFLRQDIYPTDFNLSNKELHSIYEKLSGINIDMGEFITKCKSGQIDFTKL
ncbi:MAG: hypothetical protein SLAVMIC_00730 [uncultured marine phage]|uniref:Uncharacterized protein n=1 Tax=uncultured marine phage TaxID=707152 RepID=A0A8D9CEP0_9VIRU|nr:MAG: hypothetical protein SLAVMIC_00730 [uncultured marine phage]